MSNAHMNRVARKLIELGGRYTFDAGADIQDWVISEYVFAELVAAAVNYRVNGPLSLAVRGLLEAIRTDPTRCPILADSLQEAGCEDEALLAALRTT